MLAVAVVVCSFLARRDAKKIGIAPDIISDLFFWVVVGGIIGARIFYILTFLPMFIENPLEMIMIQHGGLSWQGGLILGGLSGIWFVKRKKLELFKILDLIAPYVALGQAIGRIGCFLNGCCYGKPVAWGVHFPQLAEPVYPTQLFDAVGLLIIFFILKWYQNQTKIQGKVFVMYLFSAVTLRFMIEFFRGDHAETYFGLSIYQLVCIVLLFFAFALNRKLTK